MAVATWYFTRDKSTIGSGTVYGAITTSLFYHSGTGAFGALIIAIIKTIRAIVAYIQKKTKDANNTVLQVSRVTASGSRVWLCCESLCFFFDRVVRRVARVHSDHNDTQEK